MALDRYGLRLPRKELRPQLTRTVMLPICRCPLTPWTPASRDYRRGPAGGVCGNCGGAIPSEQEKFRHRLR